MLLRGSIINCVDLCDENCFGCGSFTDLSHGTQYRLLEDIQRIAMLYNDGQIISLIKPECSLLLCWFFAAIFASKDPCGLFAKVIYI